MQSCRVIYKDHINWELVTKLFVASLISCSYTYVFYTIIIIVLMLLQAVCCSDKLHCCPNGYTCDLSSGTCNKDQHSMSWNAMTVRNVDKSSSNDDCPGGKQSCPDNNTCCQLQSGDYGCCPYPQVLVTSDWNQFCWLYWTQSNE